MGVLVLKRSISDAPTEIADPIREFWPETEWNNAASISWMESGWNWAAVNDTTRPDAPCGTVIGKQNGFDVSAELSIGYFQVNSCNFPSWPAGNFFNARQNAGTAHALWAASGWSPWYFSAKALGLIS